MKNRKNLIYTLTIPLIVVSGLVFANREIEKETKPSPKPSSVSDRKSGPEARNIWENTPDGIRFKLWEASPEGKKVSASHDKIRKYIKESTNMEAVVSSVTFQRKGKSSGIKWLIVNIDGEEYMMQFVPKDFQQLSSLKVNDKIILRSRSAGRSPSHPYLVISADYIERNGKMLFKRAYNKNRGC